MTLRIACDTMDSCAPKWRSASVSTDSTECFLSSTSATMVRDITTCAGSTTVPSRQRAADRRRRLAFLLLQQDEGPFRQRETAGR